ncbi:MAG: hypothetical protein ACRCUJ_14290 [Phocaeicola sp.]
MRLIYNNIIPFKGFKAINICGLVFVRKGCIMDEVSLNHEAIHSAQIFEWMILPFYALYFIEWIYHFIRTQDSKMAYHAISFEKEAYSNQADLEYLKKRKHFSNYKDS